MHLSRDQCANFHSFDATHVSIELHRETIIDGISGNTIDWFLRCVNVVIEYIETMKF